MRKFLCYCAGAKWSILQKCPTQIPIYVSIGAAILLTAILATISGTYALETIFDNGWVSGIFGFIWGVTIFNLDRLIVLSLRKTENRKWWKQILQASPRLILTIFISLVVAKPLEIRLFKSKLDGQLKLNEFKSIESPLETLAKIYDPSGYNNNIQTSEAQIERLNKRIKNPSGRKYKVIVDENISSQDNFDKINEKNQKEINILKTNIISGVYPFGRYSKMPENTDREIRNKKNVLEHYKEKKRLNKEIKDARESVNLAKIKLDNFLIDNEAVQKSKIIKEEEHISDMKTNITSLQKKEEKGKEELKKEVSAGYKNELIPYIEALGTLTSGENGKTMWWTSLLITLLFIALESAPVLSKLLLHRTRYDELLELTEKEEMNMAKDEANIRFSYLTEINSRKQSSIHEGIEQVSEEKWKKDIHDINSEEDFERFVDRVMNMRLVPEKRVGFFLPSKVILIAFLLLLATFIIYTLL